jgi:hypothetical protein
MSVVVLLHFEDVSRLSLGCIKLFFGVWLSLPENSVAVSVLKLLWQQNSMKFSWSDSRVKI